MQLDTETKKKPASLALAKINKNSLSDFSTSEIEYLDEHYSLFNYIFAFLKVFLLIAVFSIWTLLPIWMSLVIAFTCAWIYLFRVFIPNIVAERVNEIDIEINSLLQVIVAEIQYKNNFWHVMDYISEQPYLNNEIARDIMMFSGEGTSIKKLQEDPDFQVIIDKYERYKFDEFLKLIEIYERSNDIKVFDHFLSRTIQEHSVNKTNYTIKSSRAKQLTSYLFFLFATPVIWRVLLESSEPYAMSMENLMVMGAYCIFMLMVFTTLSKVSSIKNKRVVE